MLISAEMRGSSLLKGFRVACLQSQEACKQLELRRVQDAEGWASDVTLLRKQLLAVDRKLHQMRLMDRLEVMLSGC